VIINVQLAILLQHALAVQITELFKTIFAYVLQEGMKP